MNFAESINYLYSLGHETLAMKFGLENTEKLLSALGNPHKMFPKIQIAGTNGKGSTCAFLDAICRSAGIKTGVFTSPHLISITERIKIDGAEISEARFAALRTKVKNKIDELLESKELEARPTFFEHLTAIGVLAFHKAEVELAILETGLGGRLDSVTAANAEIIGITPISLDHQEYLGNTLQEIAGEKAAVIRSPNQKVFVAEQRAEVRRVIAERCSKFRIAPVSTESLSNFPDVKLSLKGKHQIENAKLAVLIAENLRERGFDIPRENIIEGLQTAEHKGRLEFRGGILFDGAHNIEGAKALRDYLREFHGEQKITLIFGAMREKDLHEIAAILFPLVENLILTEAENPRSAKAEDLAKIARKILAVDKILLSGSVAAAIATAQKLSDKKNLICVTGSLYLVGEAQRKG